MENLGLGCLPLCRPCQAHSPLCMELNWPLLYNVNTGLVLGSWEVTSQSWEFSKCWGCGFYSWWTPRTVSELMLMR